MIDVLAAAAVTANPDYYARAPVENLGWYVDHYNAIPDVEFAERAVGVLCRVSRFEHYGRKKRRSMNPLYVVFFGDIDRYRTPFVTQYQKALPLVRDLLECTVEEARAVGLRLLTKCGPDAAARNADHLQAYLLDEAHRSTRITAFEALAVAATDSEVLARDILQQARQALDLRRRAYPRDRLIELIGRILHRWPGLRLATEQPVIFGQEAAW